MPELLTLVEELVKHFDKRDVASGKCTNVANEPIYSRDHLVQQSTFLSIVTLTIRVIRSN
jgi:hypothetical protein